jgi:DNA-binding NarL/FixJ family response regulator
MAMQKPRLPKPAGRLRILIVDDHPLMREGLRGAINREPDLMVCGEAENAQQALAVIRKLAPDLALVDITLPDKNGLELIKDLQALHPRLRILAISMHDESMYAERMLRAGASGYITKQQPPEELIRAIRQVFSNQIYVSKEVSESVLRRFSGQKQENRSPMEILTDREFEIFQLLGKGGAAKEISQQLHAESTAGLRRDHAVGDEARPHELSAPGEGTAERCAGKICSSCLPAAAVAQGG